MIRTALLSTLLILTLGSYAQDSLAPRKTYRNFSFGFRLGTNLPLTQVEDPGIDTLFVPDISGRLGLSAQMFADWQLHPNVHLAIEIGLSKVDYVLANRPSLWTRYLEGPRLEWQASAYSGYTLPLKERWRMHFLAGPSVHVRFRGEYTPGVFQMNGMVEPSFEFDFRMLSVSAYLRYSHDFNSPYYYVNEVLSHSVAFHSLQAGFRFRSPQKVPTRDEYVDEYAK